jgi:transcriptional regulator with XRE-family HTH domain
MAKHPQTKLGTAIRARRKELGYSQEGFAHLCEVHRTYMSEIERGRANLSLEVMLRIAAKLQLSLAALFDRAGL